MSATLIRGTEVADQMLAGIRAEVQTWLAEGRRRPLLAAVLVGDDAASETYVRHKRQDCERVGIDSIDRRLPARASTQEVVDLVRRLNADDAVSGILVQQPLPPQVDVRQVVESVDPGKDVDGFHPANAGRLLLGQPGLVACTPAGVLRLLDAYGIPIEGSHAVVIGRSNIVGKPAALLLLQRHATVTVCHSRTLDLPGLTRQADILVAAIGRPGYVTPDMVKPGAAVIDVGITRVAGKLRGDVDPSVDQVAGWRTPVPGGVGPMTRAMLLSNTMEAERTRRDN